jgi:hypothetical protein
MVTLNKSTRLVENVPMFLDSVLRDGSAVSAARPVLSASGHTGGSGSRPSSMSSGYSRARLRFYQANIGAVDESIRIDVLAKVRRGHWLTRLRFGLTDIGGVDESVRVRVANQDAH